MVKLGQIMANQANAKLSTGPKDTSKTRYNAVQHGLFSRSEQVVPGDGPNAEREREELRDSIREYLEPQGSFEGQLVERIVTHLWLERRAMRFESAASKWEYDRAVDLWEAKQLQAAEADLEKNGRWEPTRELEDRVRDLDEELDGLSTSDPLGVRPDLWVRVLGTAAEKWDVRVRELLGLKAPWDRHSGYTTEEIDRVISEACSRGGVSPEGFWAMVEGAVRGEREAARLKLDARLRQVEESGMLAILPPEQLLDKAIRASSHHARQVRKALDDLMAFRAARETVKPAGANGHQGTIEGQAVVQ